MGFGGLYTSVTGLMASRNSLDTISHNISNSNNKNYVRQSAIHANNRYNTIGLGNIQVGTGVNVQEVRQIRDEFLDIKFRKELDTFGYHNAKAQVLEDLEGVFNAITNSGLQNVMDGFWDNWNELVKDPSELTIRGLVNESSVAFTDTVNHISNQLNDIKQNLNKEIISKVDETNNILDEIARLNKIIRVVEGEEVSVKANDFRDERNGLLDRLSVLLPVKSYENKYGEAIVSLFGQDLISGNYTSRLHIENDKTGMGYIYFQSSNEKVDLRGKGEIGGYIDARDKSIDEYMTRLDILVGTMAEEVNVLHKRGIDLKGKKGIEFFTGINTDPNSPLEPKNKYKNAAANIKVNSEFANFNKIAASATGSKGDGDIAKGIYEIRKKHIFNSYGRENGETMDLDDYYRDLIMSLGLERKNSREIAESQQFLIRNIDERRKSISAVSLDEEMADMIKFQHSYVANSRVINAIDEMIDTIVNRM